MSASTVVSHRQPVPFLIRAIWFFVVGWWLSGVFIAAGYLFTASIVGMPVGFWFLNRVPQAQTLRMRNNDLIVTESDGVTFLRETEQQQLPWPIRAIWFPFGLVLGAIWLSIAWALGAIIITLPISIWMINRAPEVITLQRH
ncbi:MAG TPA: hypothetical protein VNP95_05285 [Thermomicrobiales bacterium]|nr:hypothetical protein [Thermomicrobiales bacterium]